MSGVHDDLAMLRPYEHDAMCASGFDANRHDPEAHCNCSVAAYKRVEAEVERLLLVSENRYERIGRAEAQCARLQQALRDEVHQRPEETLDRNTYADGFTSGLIRALQIVAGLDTPADSPPPRREYGGYMGGESWVPADSQPEDGTGQ